MAKETVKDISDVRRDLEQKRRRECDHSWSYNGRSEPDGNSICLKCNTKYQPKRRISKLA